LLKRVIYDERTMAGQLTKPGEAEEIEQRMRYARWVDGGRRVTPGLGLGPQATPSIADFTPPTFFSNDAVLDADPMVTHKQPVDPFRSPHVNYRLADFLWYLKNKDGGKPMPTSDCSCRFCFGYECYLAVSCFNNAVSEWY
jgi:hypothetical protein